MRIVEIRPGQPEAKTMKPGFYVYDGDVPVSGPYTTWDEAAAEMERREDERRPRPSGPRR